MGETETPKDDGICGDRAPKILQLSGRWDDRPKQGDLERAGIGFEAGDIVICRNTPLRVRTREERPQWIVGMVGPNGRTLDRAGEFYEPKWALKFAQLAHALVIDCLKREAEGSD